VGPDTVRVSFEEPGLAKSVGVVPGAPGPDLDGSDVDGNVSMREFLPQFGGEQESGIGRDALQPLMRVPWLQRRIERVLISMVSKNCARYAAS